jgi:hypothetical protein
MTIDRPPDESHSHTSRTRDAALHRLGHFNRLLIAGSVVLTGLLTDVAAHAFPGKTVKTVPTQKAKGSHAHATARTGHSASGHSSGSSSTGSSDSLHPPAAAPRITSESTTATEPTSTESAPAHESTQTQESTQAKESASTQESTQAKEAASTSETSSSQEASAPVVSGGS